MFESIFAFELKNINTNNIIDIRSIEKFNSNHIPNSHNIPYEKILIEPHKYLKKDEKYYIYCQIGVQSEFLCKILVSKGYNVVNIKGGYEAWILNE